MKKATKPYEVIHITCFTSPTVEDGNVSTFIAIDEYSTAIIATNGCSTNADNETYKKMINEFYNEIRATYNPDIHYTKGTTYVTELPQPIRDYFTGIIQKKDTLIENPKLVQENFKPFFEQFFKQ